MLDDKTIHPVLARHYTECKDRIQRAGTLLSVSRILYELNEELQGIPEFDAELGLTLRLDAICTQHLRHQHHWRHWTVDDTEHIDLSCLLGGKTLELIVTVSFYDRRMADGRMVLKIRKDEVLVHPTNQSLACFVAEEFGDYRDVVIKRRDGIIDLTPRGIIIRRTEEQRSLRQWREEQNKRNLVGSIGVNVGKFSDKEVTDQLFATVGKVIEVNGHLCPVDSFKERVQQIGNQKIFQKHDMDNATVDYLPAKPSHPEGQGPDGNNSEDFLEEIASAGESNYSAYTGRDLKLKVRTEPKPDKKSPGDDVLNVKFPALPKGWLFKKTKPKPLTGTNGIERNWGDGWRTKCED